MTNKAKARPLSNVRFAVLGMVSTHQGGAHGYKLTRELEAVCDDFWEVNYGKIYRMLDDLERDGCLDATEHLQSGRPNRRVFSITEKGRRSLDQWLVQAPSDKPRPLRDELSLKLLFLDPSRLSDISELMRQQRSIYVSRLGLVARRRARLNKTDIDSKLVELVMYGAEMRVEADLAWLEDLERKILRKL